VHSKKEGDYDALFKVSWIWNATKGCNIPEKMLLRCGDNATLLLL
jgi:hypothetical protein